MFCNKEKDVLYFIEFKKILERKYYHWEKSHYDEVMKSINQYLIRYCNHNPIEDMFDITPEKSMYIVYCDKCFCTLSNK